MPSAIAVAPIVAMMMPRVAAPEFAMTLVMPIAFVLGELDAAMAAAQAAERRRRRRCRGGGGERRAQRQKASEYDTSHLKVSPFYLHFIARSPVTHRPAWDARDGDRAAA